MADSDPFDWSVDRVIYEFCQNPQPAWSRTDNPPRMARPADLAQVLRDNDIDGDTLLVVVTQQSLKEDLDIRSLGQRYDIMRAIECLRSLSHKYQLHQQATTLNRPTTSMNAGFISPQVTHSNFSGYPISAHPNLIGEVQAGYTSPARRSMTETPVHTTATVRQQFHAPSELLATPAMMLQEPISRPRERTGVQETGVPSAAAAETVTQGVQHHVLGGTAANPPNSDTYEEYHLKTASDDVSPPAPSRGKPYTVVNGRKRVAPTFMTRDVAAVLNPLDFDNQPQSHRDQDGLLAEDVFYSEDRPDDYEEEINMGPTEHSTDRRRYAARLIKGYLQQPIRTIPNSAILAKIPYHTSYFSKASDSQYFTMFAPGLTPAVHKLKYWPSLAPPTEKRRRRGTLPQRMMLNSNEDSNPEEKDYNIGDFNYDDLLQRWPATDENEDRGLETYGNSGDEGEYDSETWNEIEQEQRDKEQEKHKDVLSVAEVEAAIEEAIEVIKAEWRTRKLAKIQIKAYRLWRKAERNQQRQSEMDKCLYWIGHFEKNIMKMRQAIAKDKWHKVEEVQQQCKILDLAISQREEHLYFVNVLNETHAPTKPDIKAYKAQPQRPRPDLSEGEELLDSDNDDLSEFVIDDSPEPASVPPIGVDVVDDDSSDVASIPHDGLEFTDAIEFQGIQDPNSVMDHMVEVQKSATEDQVELPQSSDMDNAQHIDGIDVPVAISDDDLDKLIIPTSRKAKSSYDFVPTPAKLASTKQTSRDPKSAHAADFDTLTVPIAVSEDSMDDVIISSGRKANFAHNPVSTPAKADNSEQSSDHEQSLDDSDLDASPKVLKSRYHGVGGTRVSPVDLTFPSSPSEIPAERSEHEPESSTDYDVHTPELNPIKGSPVRQMLKLNPPKTSGSAQETHVPARLKLKVSLPPLDDVVGIRGVAWNLLEERGDLRRILAKAVYSLPVPDARNVQKHVFGFHVGEETSAGHLSSCMSDKFGDQIRAGLMAIRAKKATVADISPKHNIQRVVRLLSSLYATYACQMNLMDEAQITIPALDQAYGDLQILLKSFFECLLLFLSYLFGETDHFGRDKKRKAKDYDDDYKETVKRNAPILLLDSDSDNDASDELPEDTVVASSHKKRKRKVEQSQEALIQQRSDQLRIQEEERRKAAVEARYANMGVSGADPAGHIIGFEEPNVYLHEHIGRRVKPHQVEGIRFMWREIVNNKKQQGCLLAHTMGLGKTMQVISLLVTIALAAKSENTRDQIPERLRDTKALILCPPSLIDNWHDELLMWRPEPRVLGKLYKITSSQKLPERLREIHVWASSGGVMIISYEMFRALVSNEKKRLNEDEYAQLTRDILESPSIIIADEAHKMKNAGSKVTQAAQRFSSTSRIALTGSPLANNLEEYHTMIDWIAPGYLGTMVQFRAKYTEPISYGLYTDSTPAEKRLSLRKLMTLGRDLEPKLHRAGITAIQQDMPKKIEFFITLPLTKLQTKAYNTYVHSVLNAHDPNSSSNTKLWQWLHLLGLLCNHPSAFVNKLDERRYAATAQTSPSKKKAMAGTDESQGDALPTDVVLADVGLSRNMIEEAVKPFRKLDDEDRLEDPVHSSRSFLVQQIVQECMKVEDKVLIFSHTLPTLNYLETMLDAIGCKTCRIDGETKMSTRQETTKTFNKQESGYQAFLISMRAGGLGLNLQGANRVIIYDFGFNPTWEEQAIGRAYRLGQLKHVYVYRFRAGGTFEDVTYNKAVFKTTLFSRVVDKKNYMSQAKRSISSYLFDVREVEQQDLQDSLGSDPYVLDSIVNRTSCIRNIELTETFQKEDLEELTPEEMEQAVEEYEDQRMQREDPTGYARKQANKQAQVAAAQMQVLDAAQSHSAGQINNGTETHNLNAAIVGWPLPSTAERRTTMPVFGLPSSIVATGTQSTYFSPEQAALFLHRAPNNHRVPVQNPIHRELVADGNASAFHEAQRLVRATSHSPQPIISMDGAAENPTPREGPDKHHQAPGEECKSQ